MSVVTIWLNKSLSSTVNVIETLRAARRAEQFRILCSHTNPDFVGLRVADVHEVEPAGLTGTAYVDYCLEIVRRHRVDVFIPGKSLRSISRARSAFEALGTRLIVAGSPETLHLLDSKAALYQALPAGMVPLPGFRVVQDLAGFEAAHAELRQQFSTVCLKPCVSLFGLGFRILVEQGNELDRFLEGDVLQMGLEEARRLFGQKPHFRDLMLMQYLPGPERSVDCIGRAGQLVRCVIRRKPKGDGAQEIEDNPHIEELTRRLTAHFGLEGLFNVQFRDADGESLLLEINPRMSGGLHFACLSGVALPYWAVRLALGTAQPEDVPRPRTGIRIGQVNRGFVL